MGDGQVCISYGSYSVWHTLDTVFTYGQAKTGIGDAPVALGRAAQQCITG